MIEICGEIEQWESKGHPLAPPIHAVRPGVGGGTKNAVHMALADPVAAEFES